LGAVVMMLYHAARPPAKEENYQLALPDEVMVSLPGKSRVTSTREGAVLWTMTAEGITFYNQPEIVTVEGPAAWIPLKEGGTVEVEGQDGQYFRTSADITLQDQVVVMKDIEGRREWVLNGVTASYRKGEEAFYLSSLRGVLYPEGGETVEVSGAHGRYHAPTQVMDLKKDVTVKYSRGITVETDSMVFESATDLAHTTDPVRIRGQGFDLTGRGLRSRMKDQTVVIEHEVKVKITKGLGGRP
jgi:LPS export ABC transporter protein LptC